MGPLFNSALLSEGTLNWKTAHLHSAVLLALRSSGGVLGHLGCGAVGFT